MMLQRDAKDWKVHDTITTAPHHVHSPQFAPGLIPSQLRVKIITLSSVSPATAIALLNPKSRPLIAKKSSAITLTSAPQLARPKTTLSSNAYRKPLKSFSTLSNGDNSTRSTKPPTFPRLPRKTHRRGGGSKLGDPCSRVKAGFPRISLSQS